MRRIDIWTVVGFPLLLLVIFVWLLLAGGSSETKTATASSAQYSDTPTAQYLAPTFGSPTGAVGLGRGDCSLTFNDTFTLTGTVQCVS
jgi:hypothetical protein